ncbi:MAG: hypothetical protein IJA73_03075 [Oscillospiraceae bacterium]|nr:hypothetical protein [Oscillospiraceae bacterium]
MGNNQLLPFERNRYYVGKLLTSADFQAEQTYGNHKRRFLNEMMFGSGIVCGLGVYSLDDLSIMVDSGVAMDGHGREIAVESPIVRKLSAVEGFETLESERAVLCLRYEEEDVHPVYTVHGQQSGESYECNRVREGWQLSLCDRSAFALAEGVETEFLTSAVLYADEDYRVKCTMPAQCARGTQVRLDITVERLRETAEALTLTASVQMPAFVDESGGHELLIELREICPEGTFTLHRYVTAQSAAAPESVLLADEKDIEVSVGGERRAVEESFTLRAVVVGETASQIVDQAVAAPNLELRALGGERELVPLAEIVLQRTRSAYLIEEVVASGVRRYIRTNADAALREELSAWFAPASTEREDGAAQQGGQRAVEKYREPIYATGVCEIPLGANMRRGQIAYSDEIVHGLGPGTVYVTVGAEYLADDVKLGTTARSTIYGDVSLFPDEQAPTVDAEMAVKVMNDRGSFVVAAKLREDSSRVLLPLRWVAVLMPGGGEESKIEKIAGKSIAAVQSTVVMSTRASHFFNVRFNNMEPCTLTYELTEKNAGEITPEGIYTAPGREGVFEIRISCAENPLITTYAYAVVKKDMGGKE